MTDVDTARIVLDDGALTLLKLVVAVILFGIALDTRVAHFGRVLRRPVPLLVGLGTQVVLLPAVTFLLTLALGVSGSVALGMILVACCPAGSLSNVLTHRARGDVALSVTMTAAGNVLAVVVMPLTFAFWGGLHPTGQEVLGSISVGQGLILDVAVLIGVPFALGIGVAQVAPRAADWGRRFVRPVSAVALVLIVVAGVVGNWEVFAAYLGVVLLAVLLHDAVALGLGYGIGRATRLPEESTRAMTFEVGVRNATLGLLVVLVYFDGLGGMALVTAWWAVWDLVVGMALASLWSRRPVPVRMQTQPAL
jgi:BASS family bile acid:Na+ symporter